MSQAVEVPNESELVGELRQILGENGLIDSVVGRALYRRDAGFLNAEPLAVCVPGTQEELVAVVRACASAGIAMTPRGSGTGLAGGAVPLGHTVVISLARLNRILEIDVGQRYAWVEPGVENLRVDQYVRQHGLRYAPDPSSQTASSIGGNVGTNAGGPHCLAHGVTSWHVLALDMIDAHGTVHRCGSTAPEQNGYDVRGAIVGAEGTFGIVSRVCLRLVPLSERVETMLLAFESVAAAAGTVSAVLARGCVPVALELMDRAAVHLVEQFAGAGYPLDAGAVLLVEVEGPEHEVRTGAAVVAEEAQRAGGTVRTARNDTERAALWKGRKAIAGAIARQVPDYYLHDVVVPRTRLADVLTEVLQIAEEERVSVVNVAHAGDGNLHPLILFDRRDEGVLERVFRTGHRIVEAALAAGGVVSGEHGIGLEKRDFLFAASVMTPAEYDLHASLRAAMEPTGLMNPGKKIVRRPATVTAPSMVPEGTWL